MNICITGIPESGKSSTMQRAIKRLAEPWGFVTKEIRTDGVRVGFELESHTGTRASLADIHRAKDVKVGKYGIDVKSFEKFILELPRFNRLHQLYIDEIGQMQLESDYFSELVNTCLDAPNHFFSTISDVYTCDFIDTVVARNDVLLLRITSTNRDSIRKAFYEIVGSLPVFDSLTSAEQNEVFYLAKKYAQYEQFTSLYKLFANTVNYVSQERVTFNGNTTVVTGDHGKYFLKPSDYTGYICECRLANGEPPYESAQECSHVQTALIASIKHKASLH